MRLQQAHAHDADEQWALLAEVEVCQSAFVWSVCGTGQALYGQIFRPHQTAAALVAAYPLVPTLLGFGKALKDVRSDSNSSDEYASQKQQQQRRGRQQQQQDGQREEQQEHEAQGSRGDEDDDEDCGDEDGE